MPERRRILLVDDDDRLVAMLASYLAGHGFTVERRGEAETAVLIANEFDAVVLDIMLPGIDGIEALRRIRARSSVPVVMLSARGDDADRILGLELGADDYLPKPFNPRELVARLHAVLRRGAPVAGGLLRFGRLEIDVDRREVRLDARPRVLTGHQFELLLALARSPGRVLSRAQLMERVRGTELEAFDRSIDVHVSRIRQAIEDDPASPRRILTLRGAGYVFALEQP
jgi:DNA-binding response OmpR family regulator